MKLNKKFIKFLKFTDEQIVEIEDLINTKLASDYIEFLKEIGGEKFEKNEFDFYVTIDEKRGIVPFIDFYNYEDLKLQLEHFKEEEDLINIAPLNEFIPIGECHGQYRILIGIGKENENNIYLFNVEELEVLNLADRIQSLINNKIVLENQLETTL